MGKRKSSSSASHTFFQEDYSKAVDVESFSAQQMELFRKFNIPSQEKL